MICIVVCYGNTSLQISIKGKAKASTFLSCPVALPMWVPGPEDQGTNKGLFQLEPCQEALTGTIGQHRGHTIIFSCGVAFIFTWNILGTSAREGRGIGTLGIRITDPPIQLHTHTHTQICLKTIILVPRSTHDH